MKKTMHIMVALLLWVAATTSAQAADYTTFLTTERGFTEVTSTDGFTGNANDYYILVSAENTSLIVGIGTYEAKPGWAGDDTKALRYKSAAIDPVLNLSNFFTIEKSGNYIGLRNVFYNTSFFQTHDNMGYVYVLTYTEPTLSDWCYLTPTYQNDYWLFESGKYPISGGNWASGYLGPWNNRVEDGQAIALNRKNTSDDEAGHYRIWRIAKADLMTEWGQLWQAASASNKIDATWMITNPSFETGDFRGWTFVARGDNDVIIEPENYSDTKISNGNPMSNMDGNYLMNAYQWWCTSMNITQTVPNLPSGEYELSAVVCTWANRTVTFSGNENTVTQEGQGDQTGIDVSTTVTIGTGGKLTIKAESTGQWWVSGHEGETQTFFKLDNVQLTCKGLYLNGIAKPLPNDETTMLEAGQWYYYDVAYASEYWLIGNLNDMVYSTDGLKLLSDIITNAATREMSLNKGRVYFKTTRSDATLKVVAKREITESTSSFTACALNVDGLPGSILFVTLNEDGPQSDGTKKISTYLNNKAYDVMAFSEDFNFDTELRSNISGYTWGTHRGKVTGLSNNTDGLQFACKNSSVTWANETYVAYTSTASTDGNQYVKKGYRHYDVTFDGQLIDVYITHMDAGDNSDAITSRGKQWKQLTEAINAVDNGRDAPRPKIVMGDTNCRWTRDAVKANFLDLLSSNFTASDVWVEFARGGIYPTTDMGDLTDQSDPTNYTNYEIVDKIIYINPKAANTVQLVPQSFKIEQDYTYEDGTTPLGDHKPVVVEFKYVKSGDEVPLTIELADAADNTRVIKDASGMAVNVTLQGRTLYKDGSWNTLCLPFNMTAEQVTSQLAPTALMELDVDGTIDGHLTGLDGTTLYLNFKAASSITAGTPYIIKWTSGNSIDNPTFTDVTIVGDAASSVGNGGVTFVGTYAPVGLTKDDQTNLFLGEGNTLYWPNVDNYKVNAFRAYFKLSNTAIGARQFVLNFGDEASGISEIVKSKSSNGKWFDLQGRRLGSQPTKAGLYISNGKKVFVK